jgi:hypothetical protein
VEAAVVVEERREKQETERPLLRLQRNKKKIVFSRVSFC